MSQIMSCQLLDADREVAELLRKNAPGWKALSGILGASFFMADGDIAKPFLREAIFRDSDLRKAVEGVLHPMVKARLKEKADRVLKEQGKWSLVEVPLLYEVGWQNEFSLVIVVSVHAETAVQRAVLRDGITEQHARSTLAAQMPLADKVCLADYVIDTNGPWSEVLGQVSALKKNLDSRTRTA